MHSFGRRIYLSIAALTLSFTTLILVAFFSFNKIIQEQKELISVNSQELLDAEKLRYLHSTLSSIVPVYVLSGDPSLIGAFNDRYEQFEGLVLQLEKTETQPMNLNLLVKIKELSGKLKSLALPVIELRRNGASIEEVNKYFFESTSTPSAELHSLLRQLTTQEAIDLEAAKKHVNNVVNWVIGILIGLSCTVLLLLIYIGRLTIKAISQKLEYDETQEKLFQQEKQISQARREAVEVVSHDLKNPLGSIKMSLELMQDEMTSAAPDKMQLEEVLQIARRSTDSMERLIKDLLDHAKIEAGNLVLEKSVCNVGALVQDLVKNFTPLAKNKNISLAATVSKEPVLANCDVGRIEQVLSNLIGNALKFTGANGTIHVTVSSTKTNQILFAIQDTGSGIESEHLPHVFDRFWQVKETAKNGNGLGLAIAKAIIDAHSGNIWVSSEKGKGSKFCFSLPRFISSAPKYQENYLLLNQ